MAEALGYANPKNAVPKHVLDEDKLSTQIEYAGQRRTVTVINESGLYALIFGSKLESAKRFKHWVTSTNKIGGGGLQSKPTYHQKTVIYNGAIARFKSKIRTVICRL